MKWHGAYTGILYILCHAECQPVVGATGMGLDKVLYIKPYFSDKVLATHLRRDKQKG
jgi:hypothetical protein